MASGKRAYAKTGSIRSDKLKKYGEYEKDLHLERIIFARLAEGWSPEDIYERYRNRIGKMVFLQ